MLAPDGEDADPLAALFRAEYRTVTAIARRMVADAAEAEDVAQEVFAECARLRDPTAEGVVAWLHATAARRALNHLRASRRREARERAFALLTRPLMRSADPADASGARERAAAVRRAMARLRPRDATLLALRYGADLPYRAIAAAIGVPAAHVGTLLARAERALLKEMPDDCDRP